MEGLAKSQNVIHRREEVELPDQLLSFASAEGTGGEVHPQTMCCGCLLLQNKADTSLSHWLEFKPRTIISFAYKIGGGVAGLSGAFLLRLSHMDVVRR